MIKVKNLNFVIDEKKILENINLEIEKGEIFGILGPNGSGKTTLLKHLYGEIKNRNISIDEINMEKLSSRDIAQKISVLVQENNLNNLDMTVEDFCLTGRYPYQKIFQTYSEEDYQIVDDVISKLGIENMRKKSVNQLSGGEKQRILLARAFIQQTEYIILDEPTNHLDIKYKLELMENLKKSRKTVVITLHDMNIAMKYCDKIAILKDGKLKKLGKTQDVMKEKILEDIFKIKIKIREIDGENIVIY